MVGPMDAMNHMTMSTTEGKMIIAQMIMKTAIVSLIVVKSDILVSLKSCQAEKIVHVEHLLVGEMHPR